MEESGLSKAENSAYHFANLEVAGDNYFSELDNYSLP